MGSILKGMLMNLNESEGEPPEARGTKTVVPEKQCGPRMGRYVGRNESEGEVCKLSADMKKSRRSCRLDLCDLRGLPMEDG